MPAHITHEQFAREATGAGTSIASDGKEGEDSKYLAFGAQGPDFFLHNHRTHPAGLVFGKLLHGGSYGAFTRRLLEYARTNSLGPESELGEYILGFTTHAMLDRATHPFINYFSGWVDRADPESVRFTNCHAFFERIIDVFVLRLRAGKKITDYEFRSRVDLGDTLPEALLEAIASAVETTYPEYRGRRVRRRVQNAYADTMGFYRFTDPTERDHVELAYRRDEGGSDPTRRFLALFHPDALPDLDYLNASRGSWNNPADSEERHDESFIDLYEKALGDARLPIETVREVLEGRLEPEAAEAAIGNGNLSDGGTKRATKRLELVRPLPLDEVLAGWYARIAGELEATNR